MFELINILCIIWLFILSDLVNVMFLFIDNILVPLQKNSITVLVGISSLAIAIVIFVSGQLSRYKDSDIAKQFFVKKTCIIWCFYSSIVILLLSLIFACLRIEDNADGYIINFVFGVIYVIFILAYIFIVSRTFCRTIKLVSSSRYWKDEKNRYLLDYSLSTSKTINSKINKLQSSWEELHNYIGKQKFFSLEHSLVSDEYKPLYADFPGTFDVYEIESLKKIQTEIMINISDKHFFVYNEKPVLVLNLRQKDKLFKGKPIGYIRDDILKFSQNDNSIIRLLNKSLKYISYSDIYDDNFYYYLKDMFEEANNEEDFDHSRNLIEVYKNLYKNNCSILGESTYRLIRKIVFKYSGRSKILDGKVQSVINFLVSLSHQAIINDDEYFTQILVDGIDYIYKHKLTYQDNARKVSIEFALDVRTILYFARNNTTAMGYFYYLKILLSFITNLLKRFEFDAISDLLKNLEYDLHSEKEDNDREFVNIARDQFAIGFVATLYILSKNDCLNLNHASSINKIISIVKNTFVDGDNTWSVINRFKNNNKFSSCLIEYYKHLDYLLRNETYRITESYFALDDDMLLKEYLLVYDPVWNISNNYENISKEDYYFSKNLLESFEKKSKLDKILELEVSERVIECLNETKELANNKLEESRDKPLDAERVEEFKEQILRRIKSEKYTFDNLNKFSVIDNTNTSSNKLFGISTMIERSYFIDENVILDTLANQFADSLIDGFKDKYFHVIKDMSKKSNENIKDFLLNTNDENYIVVTSRWYAYRKNFTIDKSGTEITINEKKYDLWCFSNLDSIYTIKTSELPKISFTKMLTNCSDIESNIEKYVKVSIEDLWDNDKLASDVIKNNKWAQVSSDAKENIKNIKRYCHFKLFIKFKVFSMENAEVYRFD